MADDDFTLTAEDEAMVVALLDAVLPPTADGRLPGAGALGLVDYVTRTVRQTPMLQPVLQYGLSTVGDLARRRNPAGMAALSRQERADVLAEFAATDQFFLPAFLFLAYGGYYQHPRVLETLGLEARPPHPKGYVMGADDWSILEPVRQRGTGRR